MNPPLREGASDRRGGFIRPRIAFAVLVALLACGAVALAPAAPRPAVAQDDTHLGTVRAEYGIILDAYVQPLEPAALLTAAWRGATGLLGQRDISFSTAAPRPGGSRDEAFAAFAAAWNSLVREAGGRVNLADLAFAADDAMATSLGDDHTFFLSPDDNALLQQELGGADATRTGIGVHSDSRAPHIVREVAPGSPAELAGIHAGDTIVALDDVSVETAAGARYAALIDGPSGTALTVTVDRPGSGRLDLPLVMGPYLFPIFSAKVLPGGVGYMRLRSFVNPWTPLQDGKTVVQELDAALEGFESAGVTIWILDLRDNRGGVTWTAYAFAGRFLADGRAGVDTDARGHRAESLVDGHAFRVQRPLAVLINSNSASSSEVVASALKDYGRAVLVGHTTAGGLGSSLAFPLPDGAGLHVTVSRVTSGRYEQQIDGVGVFEDVAAGAPRAADLAADRDPAVDAAAAALAGQPSIDSPPSTDATLPLAELRTLAAPYELTAAEVPPAPEIKTVHFFGDYAINRYNEWNNFEGPGADAAATRERARQRGWQGATEQFFGDNPEGAGEETLVDVYASADGASASLSTNDFPGLLVPTTAPLQLGDQTVAYRGQWEDTGAVILQWRHGRLVFTVALNTVPGEETFEPLLTMARAVEARYAAHPLAGQ